MTEQQLEQGSIVNVYETTVGDELAVDAAAGSTTLTLVDAVDFDEEGGTALISGDSGSETLTYASADLDTDTLTLSAGLAGSYLVGDSVLVQPDSYVRTAVVLLNASGEAIDARVPHALYDRIPEGTRDISESVSLTLDGGEWVISDVLGQQPLIDGAFVDTSTMPPPPTSDGVPPSISPTPTVLGGVGVLHVRWPGVVNNDAVTYDVHVSTVDGFTADATTLVVETASTATTIKSLADGTPLSYGDESAPTTYFVRIIARDVDGAAAVSDQSSGQLYRITNQEVSALFAYFGAVSADQITAGDIDAAVTVSGEVKTSEQGQRVVMDALGLHLFTSANAPLVDLPTDPSKSATFTGDAQMTNLSVDGSLTVAAAGQIAVGGGLEMGGGVLPPTAPPGITIDHEVASTTFTPRVVANFYPLYGAYMYVQSLAYSSSYAYLAIEGSQGREVQRFPRDGGSAPDKWVSPSGTSSSNRLLGVAVNSADGAVWTLEYVSTSDSAQVRKFNTDLTGPTATYTVPGDGTYIKGVSVHAGTVYVGSYNATGGYFARVYAMPAAGGSWSTYNGTADLGSTFSLSSSHGFSVGTYDFGDSVVRFAFNVAGTVRMFTLSGTTLTESTTAAFATGIDSTVGEAFDPFTWDVTSGEFRQLDQKCIVSDPINNPVPTAVKWKRFTGIKWTTESATWWAGYSWRNEASNYETSLGATASFTMQRRYRLRLTSANLPASPASNEPDRVRFFVGRGSTTPARTAMWRVEPVLGAGVTQQTATSMTFSGSNPVATTTFPGGSVGGYLRSNAKRSDGSPKTNMDGLGAANIDGLIPPGTMVMWAGANAPTGWAICNGAALNTAVEPDLFAVLGYTYGGSGTTFNLPNLAGRFPLGAGTTPSSNTSRLRGTSGGSDRIALAEVPAHTHAAGGLTVTGGGHTHAINRAVNVGTNADRVAQGNNQNTTNPNTFTDGGHEHNVGGSTDDGTGLTTTPTPHMPPYLSLNFIIKL